MIRPASFIDVVKVGQGMWQRGKTELEWLSITAPEWVEAWFDRVRAGNAIFYGECALLGWNETKPGEVATAFQATTEFEGPIGKAVTKAMRRHIPQLMRERGVHRICVYSLCVEPEAPKWFRLLGFTEDTDYRGEVRGPYTTRLFVKEQ